MEIKWFDIDQWEEEEKDFYEVEMWKNGDFDSRYFTKLSEARACLSKAHRDPANCIKLHSRDYTATIVK